MCIRDRLLRLIIADRLSNLLDHGLSQETLLSLTLLRLEADPAVEDRLDLGCELCLLLQLKSLLFGLDGLFGKSVEALRSINNVLLLVNSINTSLDGLRVAGAGLV